MVKVYKKSRNNYARFLLGELGRKNVLVCGINPSQATDIKYDKTIKSVKKIAALRGYDGWLMINLYPQRATDPKDLHLDTRYRKAYQKENLRAVGEVIKKYKIRNMWCCWGNLICHRKYLLDCMQGILQLLKSQKVNYHSAGFTKHGHPRHPSRMSHKINLKPFDVEKYLEQLLRGKKKIIAKSIAIFALGISISSASYAYDDYPPHKFDEKLPQQVSLKEAAIRLYAGHVYLKAEGKYLKFMKYENEIPAESSKQAYEGDLNQDNITDYIIIGESGGNGIGGAFRDVNIFLSDKDNGYQIINYFGFMADPRDFVNINQDGHVQIILEDLYPGAKHNYFCYSVYEIVDNKLVEANSKYKGFPKFIWYTNNRNDKPTGHLTETEKNNFVKEMCGVNYAYVAKIDMIDHFPLLRHWLKIFGQIPEKFLLVQAN